MDEVRVMIPYAGSDYTCYTPKERLSKVLKKGEEVLVIDTCGKPLGWQDEYMSLKTTACVPMVTEELINSFDFLLRLDQKTCMSSVQGIIFNGPEVMSTDRESIHASVLSTPLTEEAALCGRGAIEAMRGLLAVQMQWSLEGYFKVRSKKDKFDQGMFFFRLFDQSGIRVEITSKPREKANPMLRDNSGGWIRPPIDQHALRFSMSSSHLQEICSFAVKKKPDHPLLFLKATDEELEYIVESSGDSSYSKANKGTVPIVWASESKYPIGISVDPRKVMLALKKTTGTYAQFTVPAHPDSGFKYYEINPVFLNTVPEHFAVLSPMIRGIDHGRLGDMLREKKNPNGSVRT